MFESLIEKILLAKLGRFIEGLNKEQLKVGLWSGDITLENVYLKSDALLSLQLPFVLKYGRLTRLVVKVPWTRLSSSPVEIKIQGLYVLVTPHDKSEWDYSQQGEVLKKLDLINTHETRLQQKNTLLSAEEDLKQKTYLEKLTARVLDNLKVTIEDIHVRFEQDMLGRKFSCGVTLERTECFTTNQDWNIEFADRYQSGKATMSIYKVLNVVGLGVYWNSGESLMLHKNKPEQEVLSAMHSLIHQKDMEFLISPMNVQAKVQHSNDLTSFDKPRYSISVSLNEVVTCFQKRQFHDTIKLVEYFADYNKFILKA